MSRGRRWSNLSPVEERANRAVQYPASLAWRDKLCYLAIDLPARTQVLILERLVQEPVWRGGTGKVQRIRDLDDSHLENIVRMISRGGRDLFDAEESLKKALLTEWAARLTRRERG